MRPVRQHEDMRDEDCSQPGWCCLLLPAELPLGPSAPQVPLELVARALLQLLEPNFSEALLPLAQLIPSPLMLTLGSGLSPSPATLLLKQKGHQMMASSCGLMCSLYHVGKTICPAFPSARVDEVLDRQSCI